MSSYLKGLYSEALGKPLPRHEGLRNKIESLVPILAIRFANIQMEAQTVSRDLDRLQVCILGGLLDLLNLASVGTSAEIKDGTDWGIVYNDVMDAAENREGYSVHLQTINEMVNSMFAVTNKFALMICLLQIHENDFIRNYRRIHPEENLYMGTYGGGFLNGLASLQRLMKESQPDLAAQLGDLGYMESIQSICSRTREDFEASLIKKLRGRVKDSFGVKGGDKTISALEADLADSDADIKNLVDKLKHTSDENLELSTQLRKSKEETSVADRDRIHAERVREGAEQRLKANNKVLQQNLGKAQKADSLEEDLKEAEFRLESSEREAAKKVASLNEEVVKLRSLMMSAAQGKADAEATAANLKLEIQVLKESLESKVKSLERSKKRFENAKTEAKEKFAKQEEKIKELTTLSQAFQSNIKIEEERIKKAIAPLEEKLKNQELEYQGARLALQAESAVLARENADLKRELNRVKTELASKR